MEQSGNRARRVVALCYDPGRDRAPKVAGKGQGAVAEKILEVARQHNIPVRQDKDLLEILAQLNLHSEVPSQVYKAVAEILAFVYRLTNRSLIK
jgi:flagellar biosynthesis protein